MRDPSKKKLKITALVTYGFNLNTTAGLVFNKTIKGNLNPSAFEIKQENGDHIVPLRSSLRGEAWKEEQEKLGKVLEHRPYSKQDHANCFLGGAGAGCFWDAFDVVFGGGI